MARNFFDEKTRLEYLLREEKGKLSDLNEVFGEALTNEQIELGIIHVEFYETCDLWRVSEDAAELYGNKYAHKTLLDKVAEKYLSIFGGPINLG